MCVNAVHWPTHLRSAFDGYISLRDRRILGMKYVFKVIPPWRRHIVLITLSRCNRVFTRRLRLCHSHTVHRHEVRKGDREGLHRVVSEL